MSRKHRDQVRGLRKTGALRKRLQGRHMEPLPTRDDLRRLQAQAEKDLAQVQQHLGLQ